MAAWSRNIWKFCEKFLRFFGNVLSERTEPRPQVTCTENLVKFDVWFLRFASGQTNRQTYRHADCNTLHPIGGEVIEDVAISWRSRSFKANGSDLYMMRNGGNWQCTGCILTSLGSVDATNDLRSACVSSNWCDVAPCLLFVSGPRAFISGLSLQIKRHINNACTPFRRQSYNRLLGIEASLTALDGYPVDCRAPGHRSFIHWNKQRQSIATQHSTWGHRTTRSIFKRTLVRGSSTGADWIAHTRYELDKITFRLKLSL